MLVLREYQQRSLEALESYLRLASQEGAKMAFLHETNRPYRSVPVLPELPYVCLRVPTGGGKTLMACHALGIAAKELLRTEKIVCLWLVPSNAIRDQTLSALRNRKHPYRQAADAVLGGRVSVMDLTEALYVPRGTLDGETCIIVSTLQAFRVEETEGRKVYESAGALQDHFNALPAEVVALLERDDDGLAPCSLSNVLRMRRPVVIMDEAHNARTPLSFGTLARFQPSCIIEFTATPETDHNPDKQKFASNVLHHVSAAELKVEDMIKLPIKLVTRTDWNEVVADALAQRQRLEDVAKEEERETGEYIRPIMLIQAQPKSKTKETLTVEVIKQHLLKNHRVVEDQIAIATGATRELDDVNLFERDSPIKYIITVQALKEGWDCSFAYVLCSVARTSSARAVEQLLGRILRLPSAWKKRHEELNCAYAMVASEHFFDAARSLKDALIENGFQRMEAAQFVTPDRQDVLFATRALFAESSSRKVSETPDLSRLAEPLSAHVEFNAKTETLTVFGALDKAGMMELKKCFFSQEAQQAVEHIFHESRGRHSNPSVPARNGVELKVPQLALRVNGQTELFDEDFFLNVEWKLSDHDAELSEGDFPKSFVAGQSGQIDVSDGGSIEVQFVEQMQRQLRMLGMEPGWDVPSLVDWLDRQIRHPDITRTESSLFFHKCVSGLMDSRGLSVEQLAQQKFQLRNALGKKVEQHRRTQAKQAFQQVLFQSGNIEVSPTFCFHFREGRYAPNWYYEGSYQWNKHFFPVVGELKSDGEEFDCALLLDQHPRVSCWARNLERRVESAFWLQTSSDKFYPDFVAKLNDDRILIVEYKGEHLWSNDDSREKRMIGELWADRSDGKCLFVMPKGPDWNSIQAAIE